MNEQQAHRAGFVSIIGKPNVGKSTLMNSLIGERLSIITAKAQTTRHRILGILNGEEFQIVYSDTPGIIKPRYQLQQAMMDFVHQSLEDADIILLVVDIAERFESNTIMEKLKNTDTPIILIVNKIDQSNEQTVKKQIDIYRKNIDTKAIIPVSALHRFNIEQMLQVLLHHLPEHPAFFPKDELTDKPQRFFAAEIIREKILLNLKKEVPYACEVVVSSFKETKNIIHISVNIMVERESQKGIIIGKQGSMLKRIGMQARKEMELFFAKQIFLEQYVRIAADWRKRKSEVKKFGYILNS